MSMHRIPLTDLEREGLNTYSLATDKPSQLSDAFRLGVAWALENQADELEHLKSEEPIQEIVDWIGRQKTTAGEYCSNDLVIDPDDLLDALKSLQKRGNE